MTDREPVGDRPAWSARRLRIAQVAPPIERVPPEAYGGTERIVHELTTELVRRGHDVTLFASGDSESAGALVATVPVALRPSGFGGDPSRAMLVTLEAILKRAPDFDIVHSHLEWWSVLLNRVSPVPTVATFHGRLDQPHARELLDARPSGLVAISVSQASAHPEVDWTIIHNGLSLEAMPAGPGGEAFCFVGRVDPTKGLIDAITIARLSGRPLRIAAKVGTLPDEKAYHDDVFLPAVRRARGIVEYLGELGPEDRNRLYAESYATLMPANWPEPFGLVAIESLACGTPLLTRRVGALPEIVRDGVDGWFGDDPAHLAFLAQRVEELDREAIRRRAIDRFSARRMADAYEALYHRRIAELGRAESPRAASRPARPARREGLVPDRRVAVAPVATVVSLDDGRAGLERRPGRLGRLDRNRRRFGAPAEIDPRGGRHGDDGPDGDARPDVAGSIPA